LEDAWLQNYPEPTYTAIATDVVELQKQSPFEEGSMEQYTNIITGLATKMHLTLTSHRSQKS
jgi:hypothetical protein